MSIFIKSIITFAIGMGISRLFGDCDLSPQRQVSILIFSMLAGMVAML